MSSRNPVDRIAARIPQIELQWLGGLKTIAGRLTFYRGILTFAMLIPVAYESALVQSVFPSLLAFSGFLFGILGVAAIIEYAIIYPSQIRFNKAQSAKNDRDPIYRESRQAREQTDELLDRIDELESKLND